MSHRGVGAAEHTVHSGGQKTSVTGGAMPSFSALTLNPPKNAPTGGGLDTYLDELDRLVKDAVRLETQEEETENQIEKLAGELRNAYSDLLEGTMSTERYKELAARTAKQQAELQNKMEGLIDRDQGRVFRGIQETIKDIQEIIRDREEDEPQGAEAEDGMQVEATGPPQQAIPIPVPQFTFPPQTQPPPSQPQQSQQPQQPQQVVPATPVVSPAVPMPYAPGATTPAVPVPYAPGAPTPAVPVYVPGGPVPAMPVPGGPAQVVPVPVMPMPSAPGGPVPVVPVAPAQAVPFNPAEVEAARRAAEQALAYQGQQQGQQSQQPQQSANPTISNKAANFAKDVKDWLILDPAKKRPDNYVLSELANPDLLDLSLYGSVYTIITGKVQSGTNGAGLSLGALRVNKETTGYHYPVARSVVAYLLKYKDQYKGYQWDPDEWKKILLGREASDMFLNWPGGVDQLIFDLGLLHRKATDKPKKDQVKDPSIEPVLTSFALTIMESLFGIPGLSSNVVESFKKMYQWPKEKPPYVGTAREGAEYILNFKWPDPLPVQLKEIKEYHNSASANAPKAPGKAQGKAPGKAPNTAPKQRKFTAKQKKAAVKALLGKDPTGEDINLYWPIFQHLYTNKYVSDVSQYMFQWHFLAQALYAFMAKSGKLSSYTTEDLIAALALDKDSESKLYRALRAGELWDYWPTNDTVSAIIKKYLDSLAHRLGFKKLPESGKKPGQKRTKDDVQVEQQEVEEDESEDEAEDEAEQEAEKVDEETEEEAEKDYMEQDQVLQQQQGTKRTLDDLLQEVTEIHTSLCLMCNGMDTNVQFERSELLPNGDQYQTDLENVDTDQSDRFTAEVKETLKVARRIVKALNSEANKQRMRAPRRTTNNAQSTLGLDALVAVLEEAFKDKTPTLQDQYAALVQKRENDDMIEEIGLFDSKKKYGTLVLDDPVLTRYRARFYLAMDLAAAEKWTTLPEKHKSLILDAVDTTDQSGAIQALFDRLCPKDVYLHWPSNAAEGGASLSASQSQLVNYEQSLQKIIPNDDRVEMPESFKKLQNTACAQEETRTSSRTKNSRGETFQTSPQSTSTPDDGHEGEQEQEEVVPASSGEDMPPGDKLVKRLKLAQSFVTVYSAMSKEDKENSRQKSLFDSRHGSGSWDMKEQDVAERKNADEDFDPFEYTSVGEEWLTKEREAAKQAKMPALLWPKWNAFKEYFDKPSDSTSWKEATGRVESAKVENEKTRREGLIAQGDFQELYGEKNKNQFDEDINARKKEPKKYTEMFLKEYEEVGRGWMDAKAEERRAAMPQVSSGNESGDTDKAMTDAPDATMTDEPGATMADEPDAAMTDEPGAAMTDEPGAAMTDEPDAAMTDEPGAAMTDEPGAAMTDEPDATMTDAPDAAPPSFPVQWNEFKDAFNASETFINDFLLERKQTGEGPKDESGNVKDIRVYGAEAGEVYKKVVSKCKAELLVLYNKYHKEAADGQKVRDKLVNDISDSITDPTISYEAVVDQFLFDNFPTPNEELGVPEKITECAESLFLYLKASELFVNVSKALNNKTNKAIRNARNNANKKKTQNARKPFADVKQKFISNRLRRARERARATRFNCNESAGRMMLEDEDLAKYQAIFDKAMDASKMDPASFKEHRLVHIPEASFVSSTTRGQQVFPDELIRQLFVPATVLLQYLEDNSVSEEQMAQLEDTPEDNDDEVGGDDDPMDTNDDSVVPNVPVPVPLNASMIESSLMTPKNTFSDTHGKSHVHSVSTGETFESSAGKQKEITEEDTLVDHPMLFLKHDAAKLLREHLREIETLWQRALSYDPGAAFVNVHDALGTIEQTVAKLLPTFESILRFRLVSLLVKRSSVKRQLELAEVDSAVKEDPLLKAKREIDVRMGFKKRSKSFGQANDVEDPKELRGLKEYWANWEPAADRMLSGQFGELPGQLFTPQPSFLPVRIAAPPRVGKSATALMLASLMRRCGMTILYSVAPNKLLPMDDMISKMRKLLWFKTSYKKTGRGETSKSPLIDFAHTTIDDVSLFQSSDDPGMVYYSSDVDSDVLKVGALLSTWRYSEKIVFHMRDEAQLLAKGIINPESSKHKTDIPPPLTLSYLRYFYGNVFGMNCLITGTHFPTLAEQALWGFVGSVDQVVRVSALRAKNANLRTLASLPGAKTLPNLLPALQPEPNPSYAGVEKLETWKGVMLTGGYAIDKERLKSTPLLNTAYEASKAVAEGVIQDITLQMKKDEAEKIQQEKDRADMKKQLQFVCSRKEKYDAIHELEGSGVQLAAQDSRIKKKYEEALEKLNKYKENASVMDQWLADGDEFDCDNGEEADDPKDKSYKGDNGGSDDEDGDGKKTIDPALVAQDTALVKLHFTDWMSQAVTKVGPIDTYPVYIGSITHNVTEGSSMFQYSNDNYLNWILDWQKEKQKENQKENQLNPVALLIYQTQVGTREKIKKWLKNWNVQDYGTDGLGSSKGSRCTAILLPSINATGAQIAPKTPEQCKTPSASTEESPENVSKSTTSTQKKSTKQIVKDLLDMYKQKYNMTNKKIVETHAAAQELDISKLEIKRYKDILNLQDTEDYKVRILVLVHYLLIPALKDLPAGKIKNFIVRDDLVRLLNIMKLEFKDENVPPLVKQYIDTVKGLKLFPELFPEPIEVPQEGSGTEQYTKYGQVYAKFYEGANDAIKELRVCAGVVRFAVVGYSLLRAGTTLQTFVEDRELVSKESDKKKIESIKDSEKSISSSRNKLEKERNNGDFIETPEALDRAFDLADKMVAYAVSQEWELQTDNFTPQLNELKGIHTADYTKLSTAYGPDKIFKLMYELVKSKWAIEEAKVNIAFQKNYLSLNSEMYCPRYVAVNPNISSGLDAQLQLVGRAFVDLRSVEVPENWSIQLLGAYNLESKLKLYGSMERSLANARGVVDKDSGLLRYLPTYELLRRIVVPEIIKSQNDAFDVGYVSSRRVGFGKLFGFTNNDLKTLRQNIMRQLKEQSKKKDGDPEATVQNLQNLSPGELEKLANNELAVLDDTNSVSEGGTSGQDGRLSALSNVVSVASDPSPAP